MKRVECPEGCTKGKKHIHFVCKLCGSRGTTSFGYTERTKPNRLENYFLRILTNGAMQARKMAQVLRKTVPRSNSRKAVTGGAEQWCVNMRRIKNATRVRRVMRWLFANDYVGECERYVTYRRYGLQIYSPWTVYYITEKGKRYIDEHDEKIGWYR